MAIYFDHEKLEVYQLSIQLVAWCEDIIQRCDGRASAKQHLDDASCSVPNNIAEGNGKWTPKDRRKFFDIARSSALECASCLDVLVAKRRIAAEEVVAGKGMLRRVVSMLTRMILNLSEHASEEEAVYGMPDEELYEQEHEHEGTHSPLTSIPHPMHRLDDLGILGIDLDALAQLGDVLVQGAAG